MDKVKISVIVLAYNAQDTIRQALDSILEQEISCPIEIVIGEDASTDNTKQIIYEYIERYPSVVRIVEHEQNVYVMQNFIDSLRACTGEYIASLDSDDYWPCADKLQLSLDYMLAHPQCSLVHTNNNFLYGDILKHG